jgi:arsenate reductase
MTAHWGIPDPAAVEGTEIERRMAFSDALRMLTNRINIFIALPVRSLSALALQRQLDAIGKTNASNDNPVPTDS